MIARCLFEQSGTFKNEFRKLGIDAYDYDIRNDFGQTDFQLNLFDEIGKAYRYEWSIFDKFSPDDLVFAFFPCTRFSKMININLCGYNVGMADWSLEKKLRNSMDLIDGVNEYYRLVSMLVLVCLEKKLKLIIENPYDPNHYLTRYWPCLPQIIDFDRRRTGDYFKKPTQYFFFNFLPKNNFNFESVEMKRPKQINYCSSQVEKSLIHPDYANRFIRDYIL